MAKELFSKSREEYGEDYGNHLFEQYRLYVESAERISDRRQNANNYFLAINTALVAILGFSFRVQFFKTLFWTRSLLAFVGIIICVIFWFLLRSYKQLNAGKFKVIHAIEEELPLALYEYEWKMLGEGNDKSLYYPFSHIELCIPWVFGLVYFVLVLAFFLERVRT